MRRGGGFHGGVAPAATAASAGRVLRASVAAFFHGYHCYTSVAGLLVLPFSAAVLAAGAMASSSSSPSHSPELMRATSTRLRSMFHAAGFPPSSSFFALLVAKLSQTVFTFAVALPFTLIFLLLAKSSVATILMVRRDGERDIAARERGVTRLPAWGKVVRAWPAVAATYLFGAFVTLSANAAVFSLLFIAFNLSDLLDASNEAVTVVMSAAGAIAYSVAIGIATVVCNLAVVVAAVERHAGPAAVVRACIVIKGRVPVALALALPTNLAMAAAEALFQLRVVSPWRHRAGAGAGVAGEAFSIAYIHALCVLMEIIVSCMFYRSCRRSEADELRELEPEEKGDLQA